MLHTEAVAAASLAAASAALSLTKHTSPSSSCTFVDSQRIKSQPASDRAPTSGGLEVGTPTFCCSTESAALVRNVARTSIAYLHHSHRKQLTTNNKILLCAGFALCVHLRSMVQSTIEPRRQQPQPLLEFAHNVFQDGDFF
jgi:hypothetical protein